MQPAPDQFGRDTHAGLAFGHEPVSPWSSLLRGGDPQPYFTGTSYPLPDARRAERVARAASSLLHGSPTGGPACSFVMTSSFEDESAGVRVLSVCIAAVEPVLVLATVRKGHAIEPIIRDSRSFALNAAEPSDRLVLQKFPAGGESCPEDERPLEAMPTRTLMTGAPIFARARMAIDCEVVRHFDLEADHEIYVGLVLDARIAADAQNAPAPVERVAPAHDASPPTKTSFRL
ncbi:MAG: flavin reductase family protein [Planctomycetota bacterium]